tara:strand:+ start:4211 stop:5263 length:1053 start_codon:yes stop_codon:yes gene_type:complete
MKSILITGGAGFIGSHTCLAMLEKGYSISVIDSFENSSSKSLKRVLNIYKKKFQASNKTISIYKGDLRDKSFIENVFSKIYKVNEKIDGVIHFGGLKSVFESIKNPLLYWNNNVLGTINLLEIMDKFNCNNFVFSSSATVYAQTNNSLLTEESEIGPINPYGNTKLSVELLLKDIFKSQQENIKFASLRYFNPIGAHPSGLLGETPIGTPNNIFPIIINTAMGYQKELKIYGNDWPTKDGTCIRDYIHVMDLAEAHIKVLDYLMESKPTFFKLNVGTGLGTSVLELVKIFERVNNIKVSYVFESRRIGDAPYVVADNTKLIEKFNIPIRRNLEDMCRDGWRWKKLNPRGF